MKNSIQPILFICFLLNYVGLRGQGENDNWIFGNGSYLSFKSGQAVIKPGVSTLRTWEGCTSVSNKNGDLLFYSDGRTIWNHKHAVMQNGADLLGDASSTSSCVVVPYPAHPGMYYVFCVDANIGVNKQVLSYNIVNMNLNNGEGAVTLKNQILIKPSDEKIAVTRHCNMRDFWIVTHVARSETYKAFLLSSSGLNTVAVESKTSSSLSYITEIGYLKFSPDGNYLVNALGHQQVLEICRFNKSTGKLTLYAADKYFYAYGQSYYGLAFSASGRMLYVSTLDAGRIYQYDLVLPPDSIFVNRKMVLEAPNRLGALQLARDNKIYISNGYNNFHLHCIAEPEKTGALCQPKYKYLKFSTGTQLGLPTYVESMDKYFSLGKDSVIDLDAYTLTANVFNAHYLWSNGARTQSITIERSGTYWVRVTDAANCVVISDTIHIRLLRKKNFIINAPAASIEICGNDSIRLPDLMFSRPDIRLHWKNPDHLTGLADSGIGLIHPFQTGNPDSVIEAELVFTPFSGQIEGNDFRIRIRVHPRPVIQTPANISLCGGMQTDAVQIHFKPRQSRISWYNNNSETGIVDSGDILALSQQILRRNLYDTRSVIRLQGELNGCIAEPLVFQIENKAIPQIPKPEDRALCPGESSQTFEFSRTMPATVVYWKKTSGPDLLPDSGLNVVPSFRARNAWQTSSLIVTGTPVRHGCIGESVCLQTMLYGKPKAAFGFDSSFLTGNTYQTRVQFTNLSSDTVNSRWDFNDGNAIFKTHTDFTVNKNIPLSVRLIIENEHGCADTAYWLSPETPYSKYFIPSAFAPSGRTGNQLFVVFGSGNDLVHTRIYNRWGELLFETFSNEAWDGSYRGAECQQDVYAYETSIQQSDKKVYKFKGTLTLLR